MFCTVWRATAKELTGAVIGTIAGWDYSTNKKSTTVNTAQNAFDGNLDTYFASHLPLRDGLELT